MKCVFCEDEMDFGRGKMYVQEDGTAIYFCSSKCERNSKLREARRVRWTAAFKREKAARIASQPKPARPAKPAAPAVAKNK